MKALSFEQMQKLKELGIDTSKASMAVYNIYAGEKKEYDILAANGVFAEKQEHDRFGYGIHNVVSFDKKPVFVFEARQDTQSFPDCEHLFSLYQYFNKETLMFSELIYDELYKAHIRTVNSF